MRALPAGRDAYAGALLVRDYRSVLSIFAVALFILAAWTSWFEWQNLQNIRQTARVEMIARADGVASALYSSFQVVENTLISVVARRQENLLAGGAVDRGVQTHLEALIRFIGQARALVVFDRDGNSVYDTTRFPAPPVNVVDRDYFTHFSRTDHGNGRETFIGPPVIGRTSGFWFLSVSREVLDLEGRFAGVALGVMDIGFLQRSLRDVRQDQDVALALVTESGTIVASVIPGDDTVQTGKKVADVKVFAPILSLPDMAGTHDGPTALLVSAKMPNVAMRVVLVRNWDGVTEKWHDSLSRQLFLLAGTLIVLVLVWAPVSRVIRDRDRLFTLSPDPVCVLDAEGRFLSANPAWENTLGLTRQGIVGHSILEFVHAEDRNRLADILLRLAVGGRVEEFTLSFRTATGDQGHEGGGGTVYLSMEAVAENHRVFAIARNVTQRLVSEEALRRSEQRFRDVAEASGEFIWETDANGTLVFVTERVRTALGLSASDLVGRPMADLIGDSDRVRVATALRRYSPFHYEVGAVRANGGKVILRLSGVPVVDSHDRLCGFRGAALDVTERRQARQALLESEARFRSIVNTVVDGIITIDEYGTIESVNPATERMFDYSAREMIGRNVSELMALDIAARHDDFLQQYRDSGDPAVLGVGREVQARRRSGQEFPLELGVSEVWFGGKRLFIGVCRDISERKRIERLKDEFVSTVSHELRTPLTSIRGALGLINGGAVGDLPPKARNLVGIAYSNSERLINLVNDILDMQKIESGRMLYDMRPLDLVALIQRSLTEITAFATQYGVAVTAADAVVAVSPLMVKGDHDRLLQVIINLLSNAIKFSPAGERVEVMVRRDRQQVTLMIADHGPGIPEEFRSQIFQKFSQADATDTRAKGGTGLGLSIAKAIVDHHGGAITFDSVVGQGTTFHLSLPLLEDPAGTPANPVADPDGTPGSGPAPAGRLLVVEDDPMVADLMKAVLEQDGFVIDTAADVAEARRKLERGGYSGVTLDLMLPDGDGLTLVEELRRNGHLGAVPVVVVSAIAQERRLQGEALGIHDWVRKPVDAEQLRAVVRRVLPGASAGENAARALYVEDDGDLRRTVRAILAGQVDLLEAGTVQDARRLLRDHPDLDIVLLDLLLPDGRGEELFPDIRRHPSAPAVVILSGSVNQAPESDMVSAALTKSRVSNDELIETIRTLVLARKAQTLADPVA